MDIFPAIDLKNGCCVRLTQGAFDTVRIYEPDPCLQARKFADAGAAWLHVVDLDGAAKGNAQHLDLIGKIARETPLKIQVGGGLRDKETIEKLFGFGVARVIIGSLAVKNKPLVREWLKAFGPERIVLAFDVKVANGIPEVLTQGWQKGSQTTLWDILDSYGQDAVQNILCTDVTRDGMLEGPNIGLYKTLRARAPHVGILASGGVSETKDLLELATIPVTGAIVGKALYEGRIDLASALEQARHAR